MLVFAKEFLDDVGHKRSLLLGSIKMLNYLLGLKTARICYLKFDVLILVKNSSSFPFVPLQRRVPGGTLVSMNRFSALCG
jgi:hypothetical protein